ncbi:MAG TPA: PilN domain-containing protein, partial [Candidatus Polarisedimenticolia bacterium]|nr:PilN domain-containing protein [Candidatus Polarisedimenticolia bacterium]
MRPPAINLARRPFRNNTVHYAVFGGCVALLLAATSYNVYDFVKTGREIARLEADLADKTTRYHGLLDSVEQMKRDIAGVDLTTLNTKSRFANGLLLSHLFSWSALFDHLEELIPPDVKLRSIRPIISTKEIKIQLDGLTRVQTGLYEFQANLDGSDFFSQVYPLSENTRDSKSEINFDMEMNYIPAGKKKAAEGGSPATPTAAMPAPPEGASTAGDGAADPNGAPAAPEQDPN